MKQEKVNLAYVKIQIKCISVISVIMQRMQISTIMCIVLVIGMYLRERERSQKVDVCCRFPRGSLAKKLVPTQKYIGNANQLL